MRIQKEKYLIKEQVQSKKTLKLYKKIKNSFIKTDSSDVDSDSTEYSNKPSYMEKFDNINKIMTTLESKCNLKYL